MALIAVDIGNTRIKLGLFESCPGDALPEPTRTFDLPTADWKPNDLAAWVKTATDQPATWWIASVHRAAEARLVAWLEQQKVADVNLVTPDHLPLVVRLEHPERVGVDRLAGAVAANRLRESQRPAILIGLGTAMTVDAVGADSAFLGGAIFPGIGMSARALHEFTDLLPLIDMSELHEPPPALGTSTTAAMQSGLYWGAVGAMRELSTRLSEQLGGNAQVFLTGGAAPSVANLLGSHARHVPHLVLAGIAIAGFAER